MSDIAERLRGLADLFEAGDAPRHLVLHMRAGADEIERLRAGGCARDQGTTQYCAEAAKLAAENERLRAALERIASLDVPRPVGHTFRADGVASKHDKCWHGVTMSDECGVCLSNYARAALEGK